MSSCFVIPLVLVISVTKKASAESLCLDTPSNYCSCNLTAGAVAVGDLSSEVVDWRVVVLAGLTGALASSLVVIGISLVALWKASQKITPNLGSGSGRLEEQTRPGRPVSNTSSSSGSWAEPKRRADPIDSPQEWPEKIRFTGPDQPSPRWSHGNAKVWPGAQSNLSSF